MLQVVYDHGPLEGLVWDSFDTVRQRVEREWAALPHTADHISSSLKAKVEQQVEEHRGKVAVGKAAQAT
jgi:nicotinamide phosphoribosyltransferase